MKSLVILGAGDGSLPTYEAAHRLGHHVVGVDRHDWAVAVPLADEFVHVSTAEPDAIVAALGDRPDIVGVVAPSSDVALPTLQVLARRYGTIGLPASVVRASTDKAYFHRMCMHAGLAKYRVVAGHSAARLVAEARYLRMPLVVKPTDSAGSRGIRLVHSQLALPRAIDEALRISPTRTAVIEERVQGSHHTLEGFVTDGRLTFAAITTRTITCPPYMVTTSHHVPHGLPEPVCRRILDAVQTACTLLCFGTGPVDVDVVVDLHGTVHLIEIGARVGGSGLTDLIRLTYGVDLAEASINAALGLPVDLEPRREPRHGRLAILGSDRDGVLTAIRGEARARAMPELAALCLVTAPGREVRAYRYAAAKLGYAILVADNASTLDAAGATLADRLAFHIDHAPEGDIQHAREGLE